MIEDFATKLKKRFVRLKKNELKYLCVAKKIKNEAMSVRYVFCLVSS